MAYLNVDEIEVAIETLARAHPNVTELIQLPNATSEGRHSHALRIGPPDASGLDAVVITGGLHAREWVPPDALVNLAADLLEAHAGGTGLRYGGQRFSADDIRSVVRGMQLVLFPCVNPDGRHHSQTSSDAMWRKIDDAWIRISVHDASVSTSTAISMSCGIFVGISRRIRE